VFVKEYFFIRFLILFCIPVILVFTVYFSVYFLVFRNGYLRQPKIPLPYQAPINDRYPIHYIGFQLILQAIQYDIINAPKRSEKSDPGNPENTWQNHLLSIKWKNTNIDIGVFSTPINCFILFGN